MSGCPKFVALVGQYAWRTYLEDSFLKRNAKGLGAKCGEQYQCRKAHRRAGMCDRKLIVPSVRSAAEKPRDTRSHPYWQGIDSVLSL